MDALADPLVIGATISGIAGVVIASLGYKRSQKADQGVAATGLVGGQSLLIDNLQEDNAVLRTENSELRRRIVALGGVVGIASLILLGVESVKQDQERLVTRVAQVARVETGAPTQADVEAVVDETVEELGITTTTYGPPVSTTTTTTSTTVTQPTTTTTAPTTPTLPTTVPTITLPTLPPTTLPTIP